MRTPALLFTIALGVAMHAPEAAAQPVICGIRIVVPGMYQVTGNLITRGNCFSVETSFVTIDLGGFTIRNISRTGEGVGSPVPGVRGTVVRNGTIQGFGTGINLPTAEGTLVEDIRAFDNAEAIVVGQFSIIRENFMQNNDEGIIVSSRSIVTDNLSVQNRLGSGIEVGPYSTVDDNTASRNEEHGIVVGGGSIVTGNNSSLNRLTGISVGEGSTVMGNTSTENSDAEGIRVICPSNVLGNTSTLNPDSDIVLVGGGCNNINNLFTVTSQPRE